MNIYDFMGDSPFLTFFLALIALAMIESLLRFCINRPLRHRNIKLHGWPPKHCDADGDFKTTENKKK